MRRLKSIFVCVLVLVTILACSIPFAHAATLNKHVLSSTRYTITLSGDDQLPLYVDENTPLTFQYFIDHPEYSLHIESLSDTKRWTFESGLSQMYFGRSGNAVINDAYVLELADSYSNVRNGMTKPLDFANYDSSYVLSYTIWSEIDYGGSSDPTEPPTEEPTDPPVVDDGSNDTDNSSLVDAIVEGVKNALSYLFQPIIDLLETIVNYITSLDELWERLFTISETWDDLREKYTLTPIVDFFSSLSQGSISIVMSFWDFPFIKELSIALVSLLVVSGFLILMLTF